MWKQFPCWSLGTPQLTKLGNNEEKPALMKPAGSGSLLAAGTFGPAALIGAIFNPLLMRVPPLVASNRTDETAIIWPRNEVFDNSTIFRSFIRLATWRSGVESMESNSNSAHVLYYLSISIQTPEIHYFDPGRMSSAKLGVLKRAASYYLSICR